MTTYIAEVQVKTEQSEKLTVEGSAEKEADGEKWKKEEKNREQREEATQETDKKETRTKKTERKENSGGTNEMFQPAAPTQLHKLSSISTEPLLFF